MISLITTGLLTPRSYGQSGSGSIQGTVKDKSGAVIPTAQVHVVNTATREAFDTKSNGTGFYEVPALFTGHYSMRIAAPGMKTYVTSVDLLVAQNAVIDPVMQAGAVNETVEVNANTVQLTTNDSPALESTLENARIQELPENGRQLTTLLNLAVPGLENTSTSLNGGNPEALQFIVDGAQTGNNNAGGIPQSKVELLDPDAVQEVRVETSNSSAQFASPGTAVLSTKSGTNKFHGTMFETARNNAFGIARKRQDSATAPAPQLIRNEFGVSAGGPVYIPKIYDGHDKTFWFFAYERYSIAQKVSSAIAVPTTAMRTGDFSGLIGSAGTLNTIFDPATTVAANGPCAYLTALNGKATSSTYCRTPYPNNTIPATSMSPLAATYYKLVPQPTSSDNPLVRPNFTGTAPTYQVVPQQTFRIDQSFNEHNRVYLRFTHQHSAVNIKGGPENLAVGEIPVGAAMGYSNNPSESFNTALGFTHVFSSTFYSETILSQQWFNVSQIPGAHLEKNYEAILGLPNNFGETGFPAVTGLIQNLATSQSGNSHQAQINSMLDENMTKIVGHHQMNFGGRLNHIRQSNQPNGQADTITFGKNPTALYDPTTKANYTAVSNTGYDDASFFLGSPGSYSVHLQAPRVEFHQWGTSLYFQDNYHLTSNLTLNVGLRYEDHQALSINNGLGMGFDLANHAVVLSSPTADLVARHYTTQAIIDNDTFIGMKFETPAAAGLHGTNLLNSYPYNFLPRVGFAWTTGRSRWMPIVRGGYGVYLYETPLQDFANHPQNNNPFTAAYTQSYATAAQAVDNLPNELLRYNDPVKFGVAGLNSANAVNTSTTTSLTPGPSTSIYADSPYWRPVKNQQFNATLEWNLPGRSALRFSYVGSMTTNLDVALGYNNAPTAYQWEAQTGTIPPTGGTAVLGTSSQNTYSTVATRPYDNVTYGDNTYQTKDGWANYNAFQMNFQRLFHAGSAFQVSYVFAKSMRAGGDVNAGYIVYPDANYPGVLGNKGVVSVVPPSGPLPIGVTPFVGAAPPARPTNLAPWQSWHDMIRYQLYQLDNGNPVHHVKFNGIYNLPIGRGKKWFTNAPRWVNEIIGGFQVAGNGDVVSQRFQPYDGNWGPTNPLKLYKKSHPVTDCRSGTCYNYFQWFNGYLSPQVNPDDPNYDATLLPPSTKTGCLIKGGCVNGIPATYLPYQTTSHNKPADPNFNSDKMQITLLDGTTATQPYDAGPTSANYTSKSFLAGPYNMNVNASVFKVFPIRQGMFLRLNLDAFNVFNMPGENNPNTTDGIQAYINSHNDSRQLQVTARFTF
ncbi:MAG: TonB-dependent receptor [Acidobacteriota bacterium]